MKSKVFAFALAAALIPVAGLVASPADAAPKPPPPPSSASITWSGQGTTSDGSGGRTLNTEICNASKTPFLLFVLSGTKASSASIAFNGGAPTAMTRTGLDRKTGIATFKATFTPPADVTYLSPTVLNGWLTSKSFVATYNDAKSVGNLTVSHGCPGTPPPPPNECSALVQPGAITDLKLGMGLYGQAKDVNVPAKLINPNIISGAKFGGTAKVFVTDWYKNGDPSAPSRQPDRSSYDNRDGLGYAYWDGYDRLLSNCSVTLTAAPVEIAPATAISGTTTVSTNAQGVATWSGLSLIGSGEFVFTATTTNSLTATQSVNLQQALDFDQATSTCQQVAGVWSCSPVSLTITTPMGDARTTLQNGAFGTATLYAVEAPCQDPQFVASSAPCSTVYLDFQDKVVTFSNGVYCPDACFTGYIMGTGIDSNPASPTFGLTTGEQSLYSTSDPASVTLDCAPTYCPDLGSAALNFAGYPLKMDLHEFNPYGDPSISTLFYYPTPEFAGANISDCWPGAVDVSGSMDPTAAYLAPSYWTTLNYPFPYIASTNVVGYCVDVDNSSYNAVTGLTQTVLFLEDPRLSTR